MRASVTALAGSSLRAKLLLATLTVLIVATAGSAWLLLRNHERSLRAAAREHADAMAAMIADYVSAPLVFNDRQGAGEILAQLAGNKGVARVAIYDAQGRLFHRLDPGSAGQARARLARSEAASMGVGGKGLLSVERTIEHAGRRIGTLQLTTSAVGLDARIQQDFIQVVAGCIVLVVCCGIVAWRLQSAITKPLLGLTGAMRRVTQHGELDERVHYVGTDEIGTLYHGFNEMLQQLQLQSEARDRTQARLQALVDALPDIVFILDEDGKCIDVLASTPEALDMSPAELVGRSVAEFLSPRDANATKEALAATLAHDEHVRLEYHREIAGGARDLDVLCAPMRGTSDAGKRLAIVVARDVTERKELEKQFRQAQKMEAIGQLAGGVAHDFNNLLTGVMGLAELLDQDYSEDGRPREIVQIGHHAAELVRQLLAFSRRAPARTKLTDLNELVRSVQQILGRTVDRRIEIRMDLSSDKCMILGDASQLQSALLNLGINARDAMPDGGTLTLSTRLVTLAESIPSRGGVVPPGAYVEVTVADTGAGIPKSIRDRVFEPFFTTKEQGKGTGLGLAAVYGTVQSHHGGLCLASDVGRGTVFQIYLPERREPERKSDEHVRAPAVGKGRIVVVDDEEVVRNVAAAMLEGLGYHVDVFADGAAAVDCYSRGVGAIDLVVLDIIMPRMTGLEVARRLREVHSGVRILFVSGYPETDAHAPPGFNDTPFLQKPFTRDQLAEAVASVLRVDRVEVAS
ncbi:MAG: response regulator [Myxococcales bacterium]|nr:response regulator [Myxococcales bacterium]